MKEVPKEWLDFLREQYPTGSRIRLTEMGEDPDPIPPGSMGTLDHIDDAGQFHIRWENGRSLALVIGADRFTVQPPEPILRKLYMPLTADFHPRDEWGDVDETGEEWDGRALLDHEAQILSALVRERMPEEAERGLMHWYDKTDSLDAKVRSAVFTVEARAGQLWGVAECRITGDLTLEELTALKEYVEGQASDGWGEGFEQREIKVDGGELYVHLWQPDNWSIQTGEERFGPAQTEGGGTKWNGDDAAMNKLCTRLLEAPPDQPGAGVAPGAAGGAVGPGGGSARRGADADRPPDLPAIGELPALPAGL